MILEDLAQIRSGKLLSRVQDGSGNRTYFLYEQADLQADLVCEPSHHESYSIKTTSKASILKTGDIILSLVSGVAARVCKFRNGYFYSNNYAVLKPDSRLDADFLVYLLNCDKGIKKAFSCIIQGSRITKYTINDIRNLKLEKLPPVDIQRKVGRVYFLMNRLEMLKKRVASKESLASMAFLSKITKEHP